MEPLTNIETTGKGPRMRGKLTGSVLNNAELELILRHSKHKIQAVGSKFSNLEKSGIKIGVISLRVTQVELKWPREKVNSEKRGPGLRNANF